MRIVTALIAFALASGVALAQTSAPATTDTGTHMVRAAGMPLNDGALAPGILTVRIVAGAFTRDLAGQPVTVQVEGGKTESAHTGADGRAQFAHLPVGSRVRASATVDGQRLESDAFEMPSASGVRLLLIAGETATSASVSDSASGPSAQIPWAASTAAAAAPVAAPASPTLPSTPRESDEGIGVTAIRAVLATTTLLACVLFLMRRPKTRPS